MALNMPNKPNKNDPNYGRAPAGSLSEKRVVKGSGHIFREILFVCETIYKYGQKLDNGTTEIPFGQLFRIYQNYSDTLVGMLLRGRKYKLMEFEGEMLYQKQDDKKIIRLLYTPTEIEQNAKESGDPQHCLVFNIPSPKIADESTPDPKSEDKVKK